MQKRIAEIVVMASFLAIFVVTNRNTNKVDCSSSKATNIENTEELMLYHSDFREQQSEEQEEIRNEVMYGEVELLAILIQAEAGNQDERGKRYVADVVLNRVDSKQFPDTIEEVINQDNQFSVILDGAYDKAEWTVCEDCFTIALDEYIGPRKNTEILYFTSGEYNSSGTPAFKYGSHYFSK